MLQAKKLVEQNIAGFDGFQKIWKAWNPPLTKIKNLDNFHN